MTLHSILVLFLAIAAQAPATNKVEIVSVTGCLREASPGNWTLVAATDPVPSIANQAAAADLPKEAPAGKNSFRLIGVSEFNLPQHRDHTVVIRGLFIKATPASRINMTSLAEALPSCVAGAPK